MEVHELCMWLSKQIGIILLLAQLRGLSVHIKIIMSTSYKLHTTLVTGMFNYETWVFRLYVVFVTSTMRLLGLIEEVFTTCQNQIMPITKSLPVAYDYEFSYLNEGSICIFNKLEGTLARLSENQRRLLKTCTKLFKLSCNTHFYYGVR